MLIFVLVLIRINTRIPVTVEDAECVAKSYPGFWDDFESLEVSEL